LAFCSQFTTALGLCPPLGFASSANTLIAYIDPSFLIFLSIQNAIEKKTENLIVPDDSFLPEIYKQTHFFF